MEEFSYRQSPREFLVTRNNEATPPRLNNDYRSCSFASAFQHENLSLTELKKEHSKALNTIEILKLEKNNLETALKFSKDFKKNKFSESLGSYSASSYRNPTKENFKLDYSAEAHRINLELRQEIEEYKKLLSDNCFQIENFKKEKSFYRERLQDQENVISQNMMLKDEIKATTYELQSLNRRIAELEEEKYSLSEKLLNSNHSNNFKAQGVYKYVDYIYKLLNSLNPNHFVNYHFYECFPENQNIDFLIEKNDTNQLLLQTFKYLTNILIGFTSINSQNSVINPLSFEPSDHQIQQNSQYYNISSQASRARQEHHLWKDKNSSVVPEIDSQSRFNPSLISISDPPRGQTEKVVSNSPPKINLNDISRNANISRNYELDYNEHHSFGEEDSHVHNRQYTLNQAQNNRKEISPIHKKGTSTTKVLTNRPNTELNSSRRNISQTLSCSKNISGYSSPKTQARAPIRQILNVKPTELGTSPQKNSNSKRIKSRERLEDNHEMRSEKSNEMSRFDKELANKESRLKELERELANKERLLQSRDYELKVKSFPEVRTGGFVVRTEPDLANTNEEKISYRNMDQKSILSNKQNQTQINNNHKERGNASRNQSIRQDTREVPQKSNKRDPQNNSILKSRIIPTITSLHDFDGSPKGGHSPFSKQDVTKKAASQFLSSIPNVEYEQIIEQDRVLKTPLANRQPQSSSSIQDTNNGGNRDGVNRLSFRDAFLNTQQGDHSQHSKSGYEANTRSKDGQNSNFYVENQPQQNPIEEYSIHKINGDETKKRITFDMQNLDYIEEFPSQNGYNSSPDNNALSQDRNSYFNPKTKGTEYATFSVSFGKTQSKEFRSGSPPPDAKDSLYVFDIPKRKRVTHNEQTYDVVKGNEIRYTLNSRGSKYDIKNNVSQSKSCSEVQSPCSEKKRSASFVSCAAQRLDTF